MLTRYYELSCDYCSCAIYHFVKRKPTVSECIAVCDTYRNGKFYCSYSCYVNDKT